MTIDNVGSSRGQASFREESISEMRILKLSQEGEGRKRVENRPGKISKEDRCGEESESERDDNIGSGKKGRGKFPTHYSYTLQKHSRETSYHDS